MERQGRNEAHDVPVKDMDRVGEALRLGTTLFWFKMSDLWGWVRSTKPLVGTIPALQAKKANMMMIGDMAAVIENLAALVVNKKGSAMEVP